MANLPSLTDQNFDDSVNKDGTVIIDFSATWCGPCKKVAPIFEEIANENSSKADFYSCDIEEARSVSTKFSVLSVPTIGVFINGKPAEFIVGALPKDKLLSKLEKYL